MSNKIELAKWEICDYALDGDFLKFDDEELKTVSDVKIYMLKNKLKSKFLNKLYYEDYLIHENDYFHLMQWYYFRKSYKTTPEESAKFFKEEEEKNLKKYKKLLKKISK